MGKGGTDVPPFFFSASATTGPDRLSGKPSHHLALTVSMTESDNTPQPTTSAILWTCAAACMGGVLVLAVYSIGLRGPFILDDVVNILMIPAMALSELSAAAMLEAAGSTGLSYPDRPLARLSFALNHYFAGGFEVLHFKLTNLVIHLITAALVWFLGLRLLRRHAASGAWSDVVIAGQPWWRWAALLAAILWAVHPLHVSTVLYIVQRMTSLSALFVLVGICAYVVGRERLETNRSGAWWWMLGGMFGGGLLGVLCKENAVLLPFWVALVEIIFFDRRNLTASARRGLAIYHLLLVALPAVAAFGFLIWKWDHFSGNYQYRPYDMGERLLTEARALWFYLGMLAVPNLRSFGIYHDDFLISRGFMDPWTTSIAVVAWVVVFVIALFGLRRRSLFSFAVLWYLIGHVIESSVLSLELIFEHRNYIPSVGPMIAFTAMLVGGLGHLLQRSRAVVALGVILVTVFSGIGYTRANIWENKHTLIYFGVRNHPESARYQREWASIQADNPDVPRAEVFSILQHAARLKTDDLAALYDMARFVDWKLNVLGEPPAWDVKALSSADALSSPLTEDVVQLRALAVAIDAEISRRAGDNVLSVNAVEIGRHMERCLVSPDPLCKRLLEPAIRWTGLAASNVRLVDTSRSLNALARAKMLAYAGDLEPALASLQLAETITPDGIMIRFEKAALMLQLGRLDDATRALDEAESLINWSGLGGPLVANMRQRVEEQRQEKAAPASPKVPG